MLGRYIERRCHHVQEESVKLGSAEIYFETRITLLLHAMQTGIIIAESCRSTLLTAAAVNQVNTALSFLYVLLHVFLKLY